MAATTYDPVAELADVMSNASLVDDAPVDEVNIDDFLARKATQLDEQRDALLLMADRGILPGGLASLCDDHLWAECNARVAAAQTRIEARRAAIAAAREAEVAAAAAPRRPILAPGLTRTVAVTSSPRTVAVTSSPLTRAAAAAAAAATPKRKVPEPVPIASASAVCNTSGTPRITIPDSPPAVQTPEKKVRAAAVRPVPVSPAPTVAVRGVPVETAPAVDLERYENVSDTVLPVSVLCFAAGLPAPSARFRIDVQDKDDLPVHSLRAFEYARALVQDAIAFISSPIKRNWVDKWLLIRTLNSKPKVKNAVIAGVVYITDCRPTTDAERAADPEVEAYALTIGGRISLESAILINQRPGAGIQDPETAAEFVNAVYAAATRVADAMRDT